MITERRQGKTNLLTMRNKHILVEVAPEVGGRIVTLQNLENGHQYLWRNPNLELERLPAGSEYDPNFYGGIDELLPNDIPEEPPVPLDHGELWTLALDAKCHGEKIVLSGTLPICGLHYERIMELSTEEPELMLRYRITNTTESARTFLWKFHAALSIREGDEILCPAMTAVAADLELCRWKQTQPFSWPQVQGQRADIIPPKASDTDFLYLYDLKAGYMGWRRPGADLAFAYQFDKDVFPYCWYFASYGGFYGHYTAVLEPCTTMPCSLSEAAELGQCSELKAGETLETEVRIYAGTENGLEKFLEYPFKTQLSR